VLHAAHAHKSSAVPGGGDDDDDGANGDCFTQPKSISTVLFHLEGDDESVDGRALHAIQLQSRVVVLCGDDDRAERHLHCCRVGYHKALASRVQSGVLVQLCVVCAVVGTHPVAPSSCRKEALQREVAKSAPLHGTSALIGAAEYGVTLGEDGSAPRHKCTWSGRRRRDARGGGRPRTVGSRPAVPCTRSHWSLRASPPRFPRSCGRGATNPREVR